jgi:hypothetical protein
MITPFQLVYSAIDIIVKSEGVPAFILHAIREQTWISGESCLGGGFALSFIFVSDLMPAEFLLDACPMGLASAAVCRFVVMALGAWLQATP